MLARVLATHPRLLALHEPAPYLNAEAFAHWAGTHSEQRVRRRVRWKRSRRIAAAGRNGLLYVESSHFMSHLIPQLRALFGARFVHLHRNGRAFVRSGSARSCWYPAEPKGGIRERLKSRVRRFFRRRYLVNVGSSWEDHRLIPPSHLQSRHARICWLWAEINRVILRDLEPLPASDTFTLPVEDLAEGSLDRLLKFIGVDAGASLLRRMMAIAERRPNKSDQNRTDEWSEWEHAEFEAIAGSMMNRLGYR